MDKNFGIGKHKVNRNSPDWNKGKGYNELGETPSFFVNFRRCNWWIFHTEWWRTWDGYWKGLLFFT